jgi:DNA repair protein RecN (Recombination protein N)
VLTRLSIKGLAIIESLDINFSHGFNIITGETGAGKSILIKALAILLGGKVSSDVVRNGFDQASVSGTFEVELTHKSMEILEELGIEPCVEGDTATILIRRSVSGHGGKSLSWINDVPVTLTPLRRLGYVLIDIFGQHENQRLLNASEHLHYLDKFLANGTLVEEVEERFHACQKDIKDIQACISAYKTRGRDQDYLSYRVQELEAFNPSSEDFAQLSGLCSVAAKQSSLREKISYAQDLLDQGGSNGSSVAHTLAKVEHVFSDLISIMPTFSDLSNTLSLIVDQVNDISYQLEKNLSSLTIDDSTYESAQERLAGYQSFFRKLSLSDVDELLTEYERLKSELSSLSCITDNIAAHVDDLYEHASLLQKSCALLTKERLKMAKIICKQVEAELNELGMKGAKFEVEFLPLNRTPVNIALEEIADIDLTRFQKTLADLEKCSASGAEKAQFLLASNIGEPAKPLIKIASGGEISRIMLALKKVLTAGAESCVLVFDEIDTGISGRIADVVGKKMQELSRRFQVICISHLPQVAVHADRHFLVEKIQRKNRTESRIIPLSSQDSAKEIARLLSGNEITERSLENAKALVENARCKRVESTL